MASKRLTLSGETIEPGTTRDIHLKISETAIGDPVSIPVRVICGPKPGPTCFITAAIHGNELNGVGIVRGLLADPELKVECGTLIIVPVVNIFGFESHSRYLPDRRDLNRCFPGDMEGSLAGRLARVVFEEIVKQSDFGIDLHSASQHRTNFPNVRGDFHDPKVLALARAFGATILIHGKGPNGALRREAVKAGCPTILLEAGETDKIEPAVMDFGIRAIKNVLRETDMIPGEPEDPPYQVRINRTKWIRANLGGILQFHVSPGELIKRGQPLVTTTNLFGDPNDVIESPLSGIVIGLATTPVIKPGEPVCHIAKPVEKIADVRKGMMEVANTRSHRRLRNDLATSVAISDPD